jgi:hypothetical protein
LGRDSYSNRQIIEYSGGIAIKDLLHANILNRGNLSVKWNFKVTHSYRGQLADIECTVNVEDDNSYIKFQYDYEGYQRDLKHPIIKQPVNFGGYRYYFKCNCVKHNQYCGRLVKALYFGGNVWGCRHCLGLVYYSCRFHRDSTEHSGKADLLLNKAEKLRKQGHPRKANLIEIKALDCYDKDMNYLYKYIRNTF